MSADEQSSRILALAKDLLAASEAMEQSDWPRVQKLAEEVARQARVLQLIESRENKPPSHD